MSASSNIKLKLSWYLAWKRLKDEHRIHWLCFFKNETDFKRVAVYTQGEHTRFPAAPPPG